MLDPLQCARSAWSPFFLGLQGTSPELLQHTIHAATLPIHQTVRLCLKRNTSTCFLPTDGHAGAGFPEQYGSDALLEPTDPLFLEASSEMGSLWKGRGEKIFLRFRSCFQIGSAFNSMILEDYGDPTGLEHPVFNGDMFNEMEPGNSDPGYLQAANNAVFMAMQAANPNAIYLMQAWLFLDPFWTYDRVKVCAAVSLWCCVLTQISFDSRCCRLSFLVYRLAGSSCLTSLVRRHHSGKSSMHILVTIGSGTLSWCLAGVVGL